MDVLSKLRFRTPLPVPQVAELPKGIRYPAMVYMGEDHYVNLYIEGQWQWVGVNALSPEILTLIDTKINDRIGEMLSGLTAEHVQLLKNLDNVVSNEVAEQLPPAIERALEGFSGSGDGVGVTVIDSEELFDCGEIGVQAEADESDEILYLNTVDCGLNSD